MKKIIAFSGSNSSESINQKLILSACKLIQNAEVEVLDLRDYPANVFCVDDEASTGFPDTMKKLFDKIGEADGFIVSSPEHNGSMPAVLKNTFDWLSRMGRKIFNEKPVVFLSTSPGPRGGASVLKHLIEIMPYRGAIVVGGHAVGSFNDKVTDGILNEGEDKKAIIALLKQLEEQL